MVNLGKFEGKRKKEGGKERKKDEIK